MKTKCNIEICDCERQGPDLVQRINEFIAVAPEQKSGWRALLKACKLEIERLKQEKSLAIYQKEMAEMDKVS